MKAAKLALMLQAIELTKVAVGPIPQMPPAVINNDGSITLSQQQELMDRALFAVCTEFYCGLVRAYNDETVWTSPVEDAPPAMPVTHNPLSTVASTVAAAAPVVAGVVSAAVPPAAPLANAISAALQIPLGAVAASGSP